MILLSKGTSAPVAPFWKGRGKCLRFFTALQRPWNNLWCCYVRAPVPRCSPFKGKGGNARHATPFRHATPGQCPSCNLVPVSLNKPYHTMASLRNDTCCQICISQKDDVLRFSPTNTTEKPATQHTVYEQFYCSEFWNPWYISQSTCCTHTCWKKVY